MTASAQSYGNEGYYTCETEEMGIYTSPFPCDVDVEIIRYECEFCGCFFDTKIKRDNHEEICGSAYYCTYCDKQFKTILEKYEHEDVCPEKDPNKDDGSDEGTNGNSDGDSSSGVQQSFDDGTSSSDTSKPDVSYVIVQPYCSNIIKAIFNKDLLKSPEGIIQNGSTCSAAVIEKCLAELDPKLFKEMATSLYNTGKCSVGDLKLPSFWRNYSYNDFMKKTDYGDHIVDLIMQTAILNKMNSLLPYDPTNDKGQDLGKIEGFQDPLSVRDMIKSFNIGNVISIKSPAIYDLQRIDYNNNFVIALGYSNKDPADYNLHGGLFEMHYAEILGINNNVISYWSWGGRHSSNIKETDDFQYLIIIER